MIITINSFYDDGKIFFQYYNGETNRIMVRELSLSDLHEFRAEKYPIDIDIYYAIVKNIEYFKEANTSSYILPYAVAWDLETDPLINENFNIKIHSCAFSFNKIKNYSVGVYVDPDIPRNVIIKNNIIVYKEERQMIEYIIHVLLNNNVDITYNGTEFDWKVLEARANYYNIKFPFIFNTQKDTILFPRNKLTLDMFKVFTNNAYFAYSFKSKYKKYSLDNVAEALIGRKKIKIDFKTATSEELIKYNIRDSEITNELYRYAFPAFATVSRVANVPLRVSVNRKIMKWIIATFIKEHFKQNIPLPSFINSDEIDDDTFEGAVIFEPKKGLHLDVEVYDFASLYPTLIMTRNISYETLNCDHKECFDLLGMGNICKKKKGILPLMIENIRNERINEWKHKTDDLSKIVEQTLKVFIVGAFGVFGNKNFLFYKKEVAEMITKCGRNAIQCLKNFADDNGKDVMYGDTDSIFVKNTDPKFCMKIIEYAKNELMLDLEREKIFKWILLTDRKKNYLGYKTDESYEVKGLMFKKKNSPQFLSIIFEEIKKILNIYYLDEDSLRKEIKSYIRKVEKALKNPLTFDWFVVNGKLDIYKDYINKPPALQAYLQLPKEKQIECRMEKSVEYIITNDKSNMYRPVWKETKLDVEFYVSNTDITRINVEKYISFLKSAIGQILDGLSIEYDSIYNNSLYNFFNNNV